MTTESRPGKQKPQAAANPEYIAPPADIAAATKVLDSMQDMLMNMGRNRLQDTPEFARRKGTGGLGSRTGKLPARDIAARQAAPPAKPVAAQAKPILPADAAPVTVAATPDVPPAPMPPAAAPPAPLPMPRFKETLGPEEGTGVWEGEEVERLQQLLLVLGYPVETSEIYDDATTQAVCELQQAHDIDVTGMVGLETRKLLNIMVTG